MDKLLYRLIFILLLFVHQGNTLYGWSYDIGKNACVSFNCECRGQFLKDCDCEGLGNIGGECVRYCGPGKLTQYGRCVNQCDVDYIQRGTSCVNECPDDMLVNGNRCVNMTSYLSQDGCFGTDLLYVFLTALLSVQLCVYLAIFLGCFCKRSMGKMMDSGQCHETEQMGASPIEGMNNPRENDNENGDTNPQAGPSSAGDACEEYEFDVFFTHSSEDSWWVEETLRILESDPYNMKCCYSQRDFTPGNPVLSCIEECISESKCIVLVLSPHYLQSPWCEQEQNLATTMTIVKPGTIIVPVLLESCDVPDMLKMTNYIDVSLGDWEKKLVQRIRDGRKKFHSPYERVEGVVDNVLARRDGPTNYDPPVFSFSLKANCFRAYEQENETLRQIHYLSTKGIQAWLVVKAISRFVFSDSVEERACWKGFAVHLIILLNTVDIWVGLGIFCCSELCNRYCVAVSIPPATLLFHLILTLTRVWWLKRKILRKTAVYNWRINENHGLILGWDHSLKRISYTIQRLQACKDHIANSEDPVLRTLIRQNENARNEEMTLLKRYLYDYSAALLYGYDVVLQPTTRRHVARFNMMCFCEFLDRTLQRKQKEAATRGFFLFRRNYRPLRTENDIENQIQEGVVEE